MTRQTITAGRLTATINPNGEGDWFVLITRDGQCMHGMQGKHYTTKSRAVTGAKRMLKKA